MNMMNLQCRKCGQIYPAATRSLGSICGYRAGMFSPACNGNLLPQRSQYRTCRNCGSPNFGNRWACHNCSRLL